jgi:hypothetical protein
MGFSRTENGYQANQYEFLIHSRHPNSVLVRPLPKLDEKTRAEAAQRLALKANKLKNDAQWGSRHSVSIIENPGDKIRRPFAELVFGNPNAHIDLQGAVLFHVMPGVGDEIFNQAMNVDLQRIRSSRQITDR